MSKQEDAVDAATAEVARTGIVLDVARAALGALKQGLVAADDAYRAALDASCDARGALTAARAARDSDASEAFLVDLDRDRAFFARLAAHSDAIDARTAYAAAFAAAVDKEPA